MKYDFIEIGTSDFDSLIFNNDGKVGLCVEPLKYYIDRLPDNPNVTKSNYALTNFDGSIEIFWVKPEDIIKYELPNWARGCNSINKPHPTIKSLLGESHNEIISVDRVECITWSSLIKLYNISSIDFLKIDTEGHDAIILEEYLKVCDSNPNLLANKIIFENNSLADKNKISELIDNFIKLGYNGTDMNDDFQLNK